MYVSYQNLSTSKNRRRSSDGGASWEDETKWPGYYAPGMSYSVVCIGEADWLHFLTMGYTLDGYGVHYYRSKNAGTSWSDSAVVISDVDQLYRYPRAMVTSGSNVHVLWEDYKFGNYEVMYRRGAGLASVEEQDPCSEHLSPLGPTILSAVAAARYVRTGLLFDAMGRRALHLKPGIYFVKEPQAQTQPQAIRKVLLVR